MLTLAAIGTDYRYRQYFQGHAGTGCEGQPLRYWKCKKLWVLVTLQIVVIAAISAENIKNLEH